MTLKLRLLVAAVEAAVDPREVRLPPSAMLSTGEVEVVAAAEEEREVRFPALERE